MMPEINKELLPMKGHYFLFNAGTAPVVPFMPTLARQLGFSTVVVGAMYTILPIVGMLAKPLFGYIADRYHCHRSFFLIAQAVTAAAFFLMMFIPATPQPLPFVELQCDLGTPSYVRYCSEFDKCILDNLENHYKDQNEQLACQLQCDRAVLSQSMICENSFNTSYANDDDLINISVSLNMSQIQLEKNCLIFKSSDVMQFNQINQNASPVIQCTMDCHDGYMMEQLSVSPVISMNDAMGLYQFWLFFIMLIVSWIGMAVVVSIGDAICFSILGERHHKYGNQRLYGSIGWGLFSVLSGVLLDRLSGDTVNKDYTIVFWVTAIVIGFDIFVSSKLVHNPTHLSQNILKDVGTMFLSIRCVIFFIWCILIGLCTALIWNFLFWYLEDLGGCSTSMKTLEGIAMSIQCFGGELPFFFLSGWILKKIGHVNAMSLVLLGFGVRFILYSLLVEPWLVLPIELLNGITFGIFYATMTSYASIVAPPGTEATMQGLVGAIFEGVGVSTGSLVAGLLFNAVGGSRTFAIFGISSLIAFMIHVCVQLYLNYHNKDSANRSNGIKTNKSIRTAETLAADNKESSQQISRDNDSDSEDI